MKVPLNITYSKKPFGDKHYSPVFFDNTQNLWFFWEIDWTTRSEMNFMSEDLAISEALKVHNLK